MVVRKRETAQDGVSAWYGFEKERDSAGWSEFHDDDLHYIVPFTSLCSVSCAWRSCQLLY